MGRPVLLALRVVGVGVHSITRIHGGQKQKDIKSDPNLRSHHQRFFLGRGCISSLRVTTIFGLHRRNDLRLILMIRFSSVPLYASQIPCSRSRRTRVLTFMLGADR